VKEIDIIADVVMILYIIKFVQAYAMWEASVWVRS